MLLNIIDLSVTFGASQVLSGVSLILNAGQRAGLVGANGVGKSTLLKAVVGEVEPTEGRIMLAKAVEIGYLPQTITSFPGETVEDLILDAQGGLRQIEQRMRQLEVEISADAGDSAPLLTEYDTLTELFERRGGYDMDYRVDIVLGGLGITHIARDRHILSLSGGEKARVGLAALLLRAPDLLLLDEPTNHLDFAALGWLEGYLAQQQGAMLVASHDRQFLNASCNLICEIAEHSRTLKVYGGNYDAYLVMKVAERARWEADYDHQQEEIADLQDAIKHRAREVAHNRMARDGDKYAYNAKAQNVAKTVSRNLRAAEEKLSRIAEDPILQPPERIRINPDFDPHALEGGVPLQAEGVSKAFGGHPVLDMVSFDLQPTARVMVVGPNGAGKSTLLKILAGAEPADAGIVASGPSVRLGYLDQEQEALDLQQTTFEAYREGLIGFAEDLHKEIMRYGLFAEDDLGKKVGELSIGQRRKLQLARLIALKANVLLLDEPTNHVSFDVLEEFEAALLAFPGPIMAVSHDRRFIHRFAREVWELRDGKLVQQIDSEAYMGAVEAVG